ncbi:succinate--CoA ligase subunit beta [Oceanidesulfovibrio marinus]|uniref:ATP-grasp domain-containing protein n=1 Tax=Oceanidesulfovibrio marinus TaxID=370038 RepID=A0A6P1ZKD0_9BACT|nr:ATP-grasp domain-containing protein [Oceanidesulfovibrio marinus]QJT09838.1 ATP-grasp domain-containing protein [Oceanidesulfovibrio marinus]TVM36046.1 succinate--CoA ligase [Oceanidesulfovibrio marinus]
MKLFEYQAKDAFRQCGIPVPAGVLAGSIDEVSTALDEFTMPCVVKSQVLHGGRGKAGLVRVVDNADAAREYARSLFEERGVRRVLLEGAVEFENELYLAITVDAAAAKATILACAEGGVDIEELAATAPEKIVTQMVDLDRGLSGFHMRNIAFGLGLTGDRIKAFNKVLSALYQAFRKFDAELIEINPLFMTKEGTFIAGDGKLSIDDNSIARQPGYEITRDHFDHEIEYEAALAGIPYLQFDGDISLMCAGAGLTTTVFDLINYAGGSVANYLEFGGPNYTRAVDAMELCLKNEQAKVILIVTFGTVARADVIAKGLADAVAKFKPSIPIVTCIRGTNEEEAFQILRDLGLTPLSETEEAVQQAVDIAAGRIS